MGSVTLSSPSTKCLLVRLKLMFYDLGHQIPECIPGAHPKRVNKMMRHATQVFHSFPA